MQDVAGSSLTPGMMAPHPANVPSVRQYGSVIAMPSRYCTRMSAPMFVPFGPAAHRARCGKVIRADEEEVARDDVIGVVEDDAAAVGRGRRIVARGDPQAVERPVCAMQSLERNRPAKQVRAS
jgi:hypothetical protein